MNRPFVWLIIALASGWFLQLYLTYRQLRLFYSRYSELRKDGPAAIATKGSIYGGRVYVLLVTDRDMQEVIHAQKLSGWTVFAQLRPVEVLVGRDVESVAGERPIEGLSSKLREAFRQAAQDVLEARDRDQHGASEEFSDEKEVMPSDDSQTRD